MFFDFFNVCFLLFKCFLLFLKVFFGVVLVCFGCLTLQRVLFGGFLTHRNYQKTSLGGCWYGLKPLQNHAKLLVEEKTSVGNCKPQKRLALKGQHICYI